MESRGILGESGRDRHAVVNLLPTAQHSVITAKPEDTLMSSTSLDRLENLLSTWVASGTLPMAEVLVARGGKMVWHKAVGEAKSGVAITNETIYRIYSMTKPITSVAVMMLVERGLLHLDQPVFLFLGPAWKKQNMKVVCADDDSEFEPCEKSITVRMLLTHTSGLSYGFAGMELMNSVATHYQEAFGKLLTGYDRADQIDYEVLTSMYSDSLQEVTDKMATLPLRFQPGKHWHYGHNTDVLGRIIEVVSGKSLDVFFETEIFKPLGMTSTFFSIDDSKKSHLADLWYNCFTDKEAISNITLQMAGTYAKNVLPLGGGGLLSTTTDYFRFCQMLLNGGVSITGARVLSRKSVQWMGTNHLTDHRDMHSMSLGGYTEVEKPGIGFGLGLAVTVDPTSSRENVSKGTIGWGGLAGTLFYVDPVEDLVVIFMTQLVGLNPLTTPRRLLLSNLISGALIDGNLGQALTSKL
eukprot:m.235517 g.235517  ORF g.235517 m.235517 type:complete len:467 (+) comp33664_c13_seq2:263-1663(+)